MQRLRSLKALCIGAGLLVIGMIVPAGAQAGMSCIFAGPPTNVLTVNVSGDVNAVIARSAIQITVGREDHPPMSCQGGTPTVLNTDSIDVQLTGLPLLLVRLDGGPLAPGATLESVGASEIEIQISGVGLSTDVVGTAGDDQFRWGMAGGHAALNVNPASAGDQDVDVTLSGEPEDVPLLYAVGAGGDDTITAQPLTPVTADVYADGGSGNDVLTAPIGSTTAILDGGAGNDKVTGGRFADVLRGGSGKDRIVGGRGADNITGGPGRDRIFGGAGRDFIKVRDGARDKVSCGSGRDRVNVDRRDRVSGCERISRP